MTHKFILGFAIACFCCVSGAPQIYQAAGVLKPETKSAGKYDNIVSSTIDILPEITEVFQKITADHGRSNPNDAAYVERVINAFLPISKKVLFATAKAEGRAVQSEQLEALNAAEAVMPAVFRFMESLRKNDFFNTEVRSGIPRGSSSAGTRVSQTTYGNSGSDSLLLNRELIPGQGLGRYENIVTATVDVLPDIASIFQQLRSNSGLSDPSSPEFFENVIMAFLPVSKKILFATAKAEGRTVRQEEIDRLNAAETIMPSVLRFMEALRKDNFLGTENLFQSRTRSGSSIPIPEVLSPQDNSKYSPALTHAAKSVMYSLPHRPEGAEVFLQELMPSAHPIAFFQAGHALDDSYEEQSSNEEEYE
ncbi:hypothetical protein SK128_013402 [Halocaridina rubra]|uniref:Uncharacterized protein n=1 Tax=Halocaridina rubra TaxID=373956 RepID=A0AAN8WZ33_HALRR